MGCMLHVDPRQRMTAAQVLQHPGRSARPPLARPPPRCTNGLGSDEGSDARDVPGDAEDAGTPSGAGSRLETRTATLSQTETLSTPSRWKCCTRVCILHKLLQLQQITTTPCIWPSSCNNDLYSESIVYV